MAGHQYNGVHGQRLVFCSGSGGQTDECVSQHCVKVMMSSILYYERFGIQLDIMAYLCSLCPDQVTLELEVINIVSTCICGYGTACNYHTCPEKAEWQL